MLHSTPVTYLLLGRFVTPKVEEASRLERELQAAGAFERALPKEIEPVPCKAPRRLRLNRLPPDPGRIPRLRLTLAGLVPHGVGSVIKA